jgi:hypothetical protein
MQTFSILELFGLNLCPAKKKMLKKEEVDSEKQADNINWTGTFVKVSNYMQMFFYIAGVIVVPIVAFITALVNIDLHSIWFWWNLVCFANCVALM